MIIKNVRIYKENGIFETGDILIRGEYIQQVGDNSQLVRNSDEALLIPMNSPILDGTGLYAIPGLTDIHFHGCNGYDFCDGTKEALDAITQYEAAHGITTICPATLTLPEETLADICRNVADYNNEYGSILIGIHMEGPFLSKGKKGAHNEEYIRKPDILMFDRLNNLCNNNFKIVSLAPEESGAMEFIAEFKDKIILSLAHTTAGYDIAKEAIQQGARHVTHLYNAMMPMHHRDPGVIGAAFDSPDTTVELICDGIHLHPSTIRATLQMFGEDRVIFISDSMMATGLPEGSYSLGGLTVHVSGRKAVLSDGTIAGSASNLMDCVKNSVLYMGIPLTTAIKAAAVNPAKRIGIYDKYGSITPGKVANIILLDNNLDIKTVILKGKQL